MTAGKDEKATRYINQLYEARCNGQWRDVPELARKTEKHAPSRKYLALAARAAAVLNNNPTPACFVKADEQYGAALAASFSDDTTSDEDLFDALVCRAAIRLGMEDSRGALSLLSSPLHLVPPPSNGRGKEGWWASCIVQGTLIQGLACEANEDTQKATETYRSFISDLARIIVLPDLCAELRRNTEDLVVHMCLYFSTVSGKKPLQLGEAMATFHLLTQFMNSHNVTSLRNQAMFTRHNPTDIWRAYYVALSQIIAEDLVYHPSPLDRDHKTMEHRGLLEDDEYFASRIQQRRVTKIVESNYEALLLRDTRFPKATETNYEIKGWIELVMSNFRIFCGPSWSDEEIGDEGKVGVGRSTLDILYRAATKTFHSTQILRHLFTVHVYLGEFNLAFKAFDSYVEIMTKSKARNAKPGSSVEDMDDDDTAIRLAAEAIRVSCRYGTSEASEKALQINSTLNKWLASEPVNSLAKTATSTTAGSKHTDTLPHDTHLAPETVSLAYRSLGISQAHAARKAHSPHHRSELRRKAVRNFQTSLNLGIPDSECTETLYALALVYAELRNIPKALEHVKRALSNSEEIQRLVSPAGVLSSNDTEPGVISKSNALAAKKKIFPAWHLLSLLLSAREDFDFSLGTCSAAFEQFEELMEVLGFNIQLDINASSVEGSAVLDPRQEKRRSTTRAKSTTNLLENFEKQSVIELKMTELSILELTEGPEAAVNSIPGLLALFARLFGSIDGSSKLGKSDALRSATLPKSSSGTVKSRRPKSERKKLTRSQHGSIRGSAYTSRPGTAVTNPTVPVTSGNGAGSDVENEQHSHHLFKRDHTSNIEPKENDKGGNSKKKPFGSLRQRKSMPNSRPSTGRSTARTSARTSERVSLEIVDEYPDALNGEHPLPVITKENMDNIRGSNPTPIMEETVLPSVAHNINHEKLQKPLGHDKQPPNQDVRLPVPHPFDNTISIAPHLLQLQDRRYKVTLLVKIWLFTARMYCKASLFDDASGAIDEAQALVENLELEVSREKSSLRSFQEQSWGGGQSVEELRADIYTERGKLFIEYSQPHNALWYFEQALLHSPDHAAATVELSTILLDIYCQIISSERIDSDPNPLKLLSSVELEHSQQGIPTQTATATPSSKIPPPELYRIAARDRAYGLLTSLTKLSTGWDNSEAWLVLARAYEESGQIEKAKEALWWTVELEDTRPARPWLEVSPGGYVL